ncbi:MAG: adenylyl-sulfate kinase, partial [Nocardioides sp.]
MSVANPPEAIPSRPLPQHCPTPRELDDLELLLSGAFAPISRFDEPGSPITLELPAQLLGLAVELVDPEGLPLARVEPATDTTAGPRAVTPLAAPQYGPFRRLHLTPIQARQRYGEHAFVPVDDALTRSQLDALATAGPVVLVALTGAGTAELSSVALIKATLTAADLLPDAEVIAVPLASRGEPGPDRDLADRVMANYAGPGRVLSLPAPGGSTDGHEQPGYPDPIAAIVAFDRPPPDERGLVLFFTGLSGSGKSTVARAV